MAKKYRRKTQPRSTSRSGFIAALAAFVILFFGSVYLAYSRGVGPLASFFAAPTDILPISNLPMSDTPEVNAAAAAYQSQQANQTTTQQQQAAQQAAQQTIQRLVETRVSTTSTSSVQEAVQEIAREQGVQVSSTSTPSQIVNQVAEQIVTTNPVVQNILNSPASPPANTPANTCATSGAPVQVGSWVATGTYEKDQPLTVDHALCKKCEANGSFSRSTELCLTQLKAGQPVILPTYQHSFSYGDLKVDLFKCFTKVGGVTVQIPAGGSAQVDGKTQYCNPTTGKFVDKLESLQGMGAICSLQNKQNLNGICLSGQSFCDQRFGAGTRVYNQSTKQCDSKESKPTEKEIGDKKDECFRANREYIAEGNRCGDVRQCGEGYTVDGEFCQLKILQEVARERFLLAAETRCKDARLPFDPQTGLCQDPTAGKPFNCVNGISGSDGKKFVTCKPESGPPYTGQTIRFCSVRFNNDGTCPTLSGRSSFGGLAPDTTNDESFRFDSEITGNRQPNTNNREDDISLPPQSDSPSPGEEAVRYTASMCEAIDFTLNPRLGVFCAGIRGGVKASEIVDQVSDQISPEVKSAATLAAAGVITRSFCETIGIVNPPAESFCYSAMINGASLYIRPSNDSNLANDISDTQVLEVVDFVSDQSCSTLARVNPFVSIACNLSQIVPSPAEVTETVSRGSSAVTYFTAKATDDIKESLEDNQYQVAGTAVGYVSGVRCIPLLAFAPLLVPSCVTGGIAVGAVTGAAADYLNNNPGLIENIVIPKPKEANTDNDTQQADSQECRVNECVEDTNILRVCDNGKWASNYNCAQNFRVCGSIRGKVECYFQEDIDNARGQENPATNP